MKDSAIYALTGGIATGKSTVAKMLKEYDDVLVIDSDSTAKKIMAVPENRAAIKAILGLSSNDESDLDFKTIARIIFSDSEKKRALEKFVHPLVWKTMEECAETTDKPIVIVESALIYETHSENRFHSVIAVLCEVETQCKRALGRGKISEENLRARIKLQLPNEVKDERADFVIDSNCALQELQNKVDVLHSFLKDYFPFVQA